METLVSAPPAEIDEDLELAPAPNGAPRPGRGPEPDRARDADRTQRILVAATVALLSALFLANAASWIASGFGESHDGRNASIWAEGSRALREDGVAASRFGGRYDGQRYASHPPGIVAEIALAELVGGEHRAVTRSPAWIGSIATAVLLALLLWELGLSAAAIAAGLAAALSSAMFLVYGTMLDTPMTALPFALAFVLVVQRSIDGRRVRPAAVGALGLAVALSGWAALVIAGSQVIRLALPAHRRRTGWRPVLAAIGGLGAGLVVSFSWSLWVYGSFAVMHDKVIDKTNSDPLTEAIARQTESLSDLLAVGLVLAALGAVIALVALPDRRWRGPFGSVLGAIVVYAGVLHGGAAMHDYWNFALIVPVAIAVGAGVEAILRRAPSGSKARTQIVGTGLALLFALVSTRYVSDAEAIQSNGVAAQRLLAAAEEVAPREGPVIAYLETRGMPSSWIPYESRRPALALEGTDDLADLVERNPDFPVLVPWVTYAPDIQARAKEAAYAVDGSYAVEPASFVLSLRQGG